jgi:cardiolipin synthase
MQQDLDDARHSAYVQTFTFEGDRVGVGLGRALKRCAASDRRLRIDRYSLLYHSDRLIPVRGLFDRSLRREVALTRRWVHRLRADGVGVTFANRLGPSPVKLLRRNHKKVVSIDDRITYLGGINFSEHNFAWHDLMIRVECPDVGGLMAADFRTGWDGPATNFDRTVGPLRIISMNGRGNRRAFRPVIDAIESARSTIDVVSAYLSEPFTGYLSRAAKRGVRVRVLTPSQNNKANLARHVLERAARGGFEILRYHGGMSHMKAMVIDDDRLVAGSTNFDFMSYNVLEEHIIVTRDPGLVAAFRQRVWNPDARNSESVVPASSVGTKLGDLAIRVGAGIAARLALPQGDPG